MFIVNDKEKEMTKRYELVGELRAFLEANVKPEHLNKVLERCVNEYVIDLHKADFYVPSYESKLGNGFTVYKESEFFKEVVEYDPKVWNEYSKVKPPKKGYYRVELRNDSGEVELRSVEYWDKTFEASYLSPKPLNLFFKPWDDEE